MRFMLPCRAHACAGVVTPLACESSCRVDGGPGLAAAACAPRMKWSGKIRLEDLSRGSGPGNMSVGISGALTMTRISALLLLASLMIAAPAFAASGPSYNYAEIGYTYLDPDDFPSEDGAGAGGSIALYPNVHVVADYDQIRGGGVKAHFTRVAIGFNSYIDHRSDFIVRAGYFRSEAGQTDDGFLAEVGARAIFFGRLELNTFVTYYDDSAFGQDISFSVGGVFNFTEHFGLSLRADASTERTQAQARLRYSF